MTASSPKSSRIFFMASALDAALYFFIFTIHSPPQHFVLQSMILIHYKKESEFAGNIFPLFVVSTFELLVNISIIGDWSINETRSISFAIDSKIVVNHLGQWINNSHVLFVEYYQQLVFQLFLKPLILSTNCLLPSILRSNLSC